MIRYLVPARLDAPTPRHKRMHVTVRDALGIASFGAVVTTLWSAAEGLAPWLPSVVAAAALVGLTWWAFSAKRGVPDLYRYAPTAPAEARARGHLTTAVVEDRQVSRSRLRRTSQVSWRLLVVDADGRRYRTTTAQVLAEPPGHEPGDVVAVRVHPDDRGVVTIVDDEPPLPRPSAPDRPVPRYSGVPPHTRGILVRELWAALLGLAALTVGALAPLAVTALVG